MPARPEVVELYLVTLAKSGAKVATIEQRRAAIGYLHRIAGQDNPCKTDNVIEAMKGIRRSKKDRPVPKEHLSPDALAQIVATLPDDLRGLRDRALLLIGLAGAFRRSELVAVHVEHVTIRRDDGRDVMSIDVPESKTTQEGEPLYKTIPALPDKRVCPIAAYRAWMNAAGIQSGHVFRPIDRWGNLRAGGMDGQEVARIVKRVAAAAGYTESELKRYAGHSLRSGYVTAATQAGANDSDIMEQTGHQTSATLRRYRQLAGKGAQRATLAAFGVKDR
jgi:site-specific recombinase XerD